MAFFSRMLAGVNLLKYIDASLVAICLPNDRCYRLVAPSCSPGFSQNLPGRLVVCVYVPQCYLGCSHRLLSHRRQRTYSPSMVEIEQKFNFTPDIGMVASVRINTCLRP